MTKYKTRRQTALKALGRPWAYASLLWYWHSERSRAQDEGIASPRSSGRFEGSPTCDPSVFPGLPIRNKPKPDRRSSPPQVVKWKGKQ